MKHSARFGSTALVLFCAFYLPAPAGAALTNVKIVGQSGEALGDATVSFTSPDGKEQRQQTDDKGVAVFDLQQNVRYRFQAVDPRYLSLDGYRTIGDGEKGFSVNLAAPDGSHLQYTQRRDFSFSIGSSMESYNDIGLNRGEVEFRQPNVPPRTEEFDANGDTTDLSLDAVYGELNYGLLRFGSGRFAGDFGARARIGSGSLTFGERSNNPSFPGVDFSGRGLFWSLGVGGRADVGWPVDLLGGIEYRSLAGVGLDQDPDYFNGFSDGNGSYSDWRLHVGLAAPLGHLMTIRRHPCLERLTFELGAILMLSTTSFNFIAIDTMYPDRSSRVTKDFSETSIRGYVGLGFPIYRNLMGRVGAEVGQDGSTIGLSVGYWGHSPF